MQMTPCRTCPMRGDCRKRDRMRTDCHGLGLTAIKFRCQILKDAFRPGMKVRAKLDYVAYGEYQSCEDAGILTRFQEVDAYVMAFNGPKVRIFVPYDETQIAGKDHPEWWLQKLSSYNDENRFIHVLRVNPDRLEALGDRVAACKHCGLPDGFDIPIGWTCRTATEDRGMGYYETVSLDCEYEEVAHAPQSN